MSSASPPGHRATMRTVVLEWGRLGCVGFGGPPTHIRLLRDLCVERRRWLDAEEFEDAIAACNMLPGPASTQLAIYCAARVRGPWGGLVGGLAFIVPGLVLVLALAALFLSGPPTWVLAAGAGAGAAVAAVALDAAGGLLPSSWRRTPSRPRWVLYVVLTAAATVLAGPWVVLALLGCGLAELLVRRPPRAGRAAEGTTLASWLPMLGLWGALGSLSTLASLTWTAFKVGALSYGGGFVIIPLMQADAVERHGWLSGPEFLNAVALGQVTPGPVVQTVAVVGYAAAGLVGGLLASLVAFGPSFVLVLGGAGRFDALRGNARVRAFLDGCGPAAIGAILGSAWLLAAPLTQPWQYAVLAGAAVLLLAWRRGVVLTLLAAASAGVVLVAAGQPLG